jgi:hypothetical protein
MYVGPVLQKNAVFKRRIYFVLAHVKENHMVTVHDTHSRNCEIHALMVRGAVCRVRPICVKCWEIFLTFQVCVRK